MFYDTGTRHEKVLTKNTPRVCDLEDIIFCPRVMATYAFLAITLILFLTNFFKKSYSTKGRKRISFSKKKKIGHDARLLLIVDKNCMF